ncbi:MAG: phage portal protein [Gemmataceae bacterium]|nr:phage portal protein [Gemmataceae bacterium]
MIRSLLKRLGAWLFPSPPTEIASLARPPLERAPSPGDLLHELRDTAWTCASINAATCASFPPRLFVKTRPGEPMPRAATRPIPAADMRRFPQAAGAQVQEVASHPLLDLLRQVNPVHNAFDLWELTQLYQETVGSAYWLLEPGPLGIPSAIWPLPAHRVVPVEGGYAYRGPMGEERYPTERVIAFRYPDPRDPFTSGLSPLRACFGQARLASELTLFKRAKLDNHALPDAIVSPDTVLGEDERARLESQWNSKLRRGGAGRVLVAESALRVQLLQHSLGDVAVLADLKATREEICNAFHVPLAYLSTETNLANLQAAEQQHLARAILPRLRRRDEKLNEQLVPLYDPTGRLFLASDDPTPSNREMALRERELALKYGVLTPNEVRAALGLPPVPWGDAPWQAPAKA